MNRFRLITITALAVALLAMPAVAAAATLTIAGSAQGTASAQPPTTEASCDPQSGSGGADLICDFDIAGTFDVSGLGSGTYAGTTRVDWSIYTGTAPCARLTGTMVLTNDDGSITLDITGASRVCETDDADVHESTMVATVVSGTGAYAGATGTITGEGTLTAGETEGEYDAEQVLAGSVTVPDPEPTVAPTVAPTQPAAATVAPTATATPAVDQLPDTASGNDTTLPTILVLAGLLIGSAGIRVHGARNRA